MNELLQPKKLVGNKMRFGHYFNPVVILIRTVVEMTDGSGNTAGYLEDPLTRCGVRGLVDWAISIMSSRWTSGSNAGGPVASPAHPSCFNWAVVSSPLVSGLSVNMSSRYRLQTSTQTSGGMDRFTFWGFLLNEEPWSVPGESFDLDMFWDLQIVG